MSSRATWSSGMFALDQLNQSVGQVELTTIAAQYDGFHRILSCSFEFTWNQSLDLPRPQRGQIATRADYASLLNATLRVEYQSIRVLEASSLCVLNGPTGYIMEMSGVMSPEILDAIEQKRNGRAVSLTVTLQFVASRSAFGYDQQRNSISQKGEMRLLRARWNPEIAASDWLEQYLPAWAYHGPRYVELPPLPSFEPAQSVSQHFDQALHTLKQGLFRNVPTSCLAALEAVAKTKGYSGLLAVPEATQWKVPGLPEMSQILNKLRNYMNRY